MAAAIPVAQNIKFIRRGGIHPARERLRRRRPWRGEGHPALRSSGWLRPSGLSGRFGRFVGAGFIPPANVCAIAGSGGVRAPRPTNARVVATVRFGRSFRKVCRGGIHPAREPRAAIGTPGFAPRPKIHPEQAPLSKGAGCGQSPQTGGLPSGTMPPPGSLHSRGLPPGKLPPPGPPPKRAPFRQRISRRNNPSSSLRSATSL